MAFKKAQPSSKAPNICMAVLIHQLLLGAYRASSNIQSTSLAALQAPQNQSHESERVLKGAFGELERPIQHLVRFEKLINSIDLSDDNTVVAERLNNFLNEVYSDYESTSEQQVANARMAMENLARDNRVPKDFSY